ncbi:MAG: DNA-primase RepB domain-containing protein, partial [Comamonadaceae bacterium]
CCKPDIIIESSPGKWHCYYFTNDCQLSEFTTRQKQIALKFNSDPSVNDLPRVMRLPGFWHQKDTPFMTRIVSQE